MRRSFWSKKYRIRQNQRQIGETPCLIYYSQGRIMNPISFFVGIFGFKADIINLKFEEVYNEHCHKQK
jgi:hypothetical protein